MQPKAPAAGTSWVTELRRWRHTGLSSLLGTGGCNCQGKKLITRCQGPHSLDILLLLTRRLQAGLQGPRAPGRPGAACAAAEATPGSASSRWRSRPRLERGQAGGGDGEGAARRTLGPRCGRRGGSSALGASLPGSRRRRSPIHSPRRCVRGGSGEQREFPTGGPGNAGGSGKGREKRAIPLPTPGCTCEEPPLPAAPGGGSICGSTLRRQLRTRRSQSPPLPVPRLRGAAEPGPTCPHRAGARKAKGGERRRGRGSMAHAPAAPREGRGGVRMRAAGGPGRWAGAAAAPVRLRCCLRALTLCAAAGGARCGGQR